MIYLASPYTHEKKDVMHERYLQNVSAVGKLAKDLKQEVYSPIVHWHNIAIMCDLPRDFLFWKRQNFAILRFCSEFVILTLPGWKASKGIREENYCANYLGLPTFYLNPETYNMTPFENH